VRRNGRDLRGNEPREQQQGGDDGASKRGSGEQGASWMVGHGGLRRRERSRIELLRQQGPASEAQSDTGSVLICRLDIHDVGAVMGQPSM
jgi:hypothetical protein